MTVESTCVGCGRECLDTTQFRCGREEVNACEECRDSGIPSVCGKCRDRAVGVVPVGLHPCRSFMQDEAGVYRDLQARLAVNGSVAV